MASREQRGGLWAPLLRTNAMGPLVVVGLAMALALALLALSRRPGASDVVKTGATAAQTARRAQHKGKNARQRMMLTFAINALENDMLRRVVVMGLKVARSRL